MTLFARLKSVFALRTEPALRWRAAGAAEVTRTEIHVLDVVGASHAADQVREAFLLPTRRDPSLVDLWAWRASGSPLLEEVYLGTFLAESPDRRETQRRLRAAGLGI